MVLEKVFRVVICIRLLFTYSERALASLLYSTKQVLFLYSLELKTLGKPHHMNFRNLSACVVYIFVLMKK